MQELFGEHVELGRVREVVDDLAVGLQRAEGGLEGLPGEGEWGSAASVRDAQKNDHVRLRRFGEQRVGRRVRLRRGRHVIVRRDDGRAPRVEREVVRRGRRVESRLPGIDESRRPLFIGSARVRGSARRPAAELRLNPLSELSETSAVQEQCFVKPFEQVLDLVGGDQRPKPAHVAHLGLADGTGAVELAQQESNVGGHQQLL